MLVVTTLGLQSTSIAVRYCTCSMLFEGRERAYFAGLHLILYARCRRKFYSGTWLRPSSGGAVCRFLDISTVGEVNGL